MSRGHGRFEPNERLPKFGDYRNGQMGGSMTATPFPASSGGLAPPQLARRQQRPDYCYDYPELLPSGAAGGGGGGGAGDHMTGGSLTQPEFPSDSDTAPLPAANLQQRQQQMHQMQQMQQQQQQHFQPARRLDTGGSSFRSGSGSRTLLQSAPTTTEMTPGYRSNNNPGGHGRHGGGPVMPISNSSYNDLSSGSENMFQEYHRLFQQQQQQQQQLLHQQQQQQQFQQQQQQQYQQQPSRNNMYLNEPSQRQSSAAMTLPPAPPQPMQANNYAESADRRRRRLNYSEDFDVEDSQRRRHRRSARLETPGDFSQARHQQERYPHQRHQRSRPVADTEYDGSSSSNDDADKFLNSNPPDDWRTALRRDRGSRRRRRGTTTLADSSAEMSMLSPMPQPPLPMALSPARQALRQRQGERQRRQQTASARQAWLPSFNEAAYFNNTNNRQQQQQQQPLDYFNYPPSRGGAPTYPPPVEIDEFSSGEDSRRQQRGHRRRMASEGAGVAGFAGVGWRENGRTSETVFSCPHVELVLQTRSYECRRCGRCCTRITPQTVPASRQLQQSHQPMASESPIPMSQGLISMSPMELPPNAASSSLRSHQRSRRNHLHQRAVAAAAGAAPRVDPGLGDFSDFTENEEEQGAAGNRADWDWGPPRSAQDNSAAFEALAKMARRKASSSRWGGGGGGGDDFQRHQQQQQQQPQQSMRGYLPEVRSHRQYHHSRRRY